MNSQALNTICKIAQAVVIALAPMCCAIKANAQACTATEPRANFVSSPSRGIRGKDYDLTLQNSHCDMSSLILQAPRGSGVNVIEKINSGSNVVIYHIQLDKDAPTASVLLSLSSSGNIITTIPFEVAASTPGALPPDLSPQVDIQWHVVDPDVVEDNFGHRVRDKFYCIQMTLGNNSGYDLQIASVGFTLNRSIGKGLGNTDYSLVRGTLDWGQKMNKWNLINLSVVAAGPLLTSTLPLVVDSAKRAHRAELVNLLSPLGIALAFIYPFHDSFAAQFKHLDDSTLRQGFILHNNVQAPPVLVFVAKGALQGVGDKKEPCSNSRNWIIRPVTERKEYPDCIKQKLGKVVLVGETIAYLNRVSVLESSGGAAPTPLVSLSASSLAFADDKSGPTTITLTNLGTAPLIITNFTIQTGTDNFKYQLVPAPNKCASLPATLGVQETCNVTIIFTPPAAVGTVSGVLEVEDNASDSPQQVTLTGTKSK